MSSVISLAGTLNAPPASGVSDLLDAQVRRRPDDVALEAPGWSPATYRQLAANAAEISRQLREKGLGRTDRVAVVLPNGPEMATAFLAVSMGGICAPLNHGYRQSEFDFLLSDLGARALIVSAEDDSPARAAARARGVPILEASPVPGAAAGSFTLSGAAAAPAPADVGAPEDMALILYTSGMTSRPKAVPLSHRGICTSAHNIGLALELQPTDRCINVMPLFHAHGLIIAVLSSLMTGGSVVCSPGFSAEDFFEWMETFRPTWYTAAPTIHHAVLESAAAHRGFLEQHPLRFIRSSAAFLPPSVRTGLEREFGAPVIEGYGMTECTQITSNPLDAAGRRAGSVGVPMGPTVAIMDDAGNLLPPGEAGEIVIRGPAVVRGYDRSPAADQSAFVGGWFRTGDQGVLSSEGYLSLTGRLKEMINCGGEKLAPSEVDEVLMDHPAVFQAVAFGVPHPTLGEDVAAAVVLRGNASATEKELREFAATRLADYKVPRQILIVSEIPKGPTGKLRRVGLAEALGIVPAESGRSPRDAGSPEEAGSVEDRLAKIWAELLNVEPVEADSNFFRLGGDSILASRLVARVRKELRVEIPLRSLFETPTFAELSAVVARRKREPSPSAAAATGSPRPTTAASGGGGQIPIERVGSTEPLRPTAPASTRTSSGDNGASFSFFFFSADGSTAAPDKYRMVLEVSQFADRHGYSAVWTPERHFHTFGGLYPNPAVLGAAIAAVTSRIQVRAGSVVLPLQHPIRVAEEWSVLDNLSHGRVGISFASGWHVNDFVLWPSNYEDRKRVMFEGIQIVRDLWEGRSVTLPNGVGKEIPVSIFPRPLQPSLPIWLSCQSEATFRKAGELGVNVVTAMYSLSVEELKGRIAIYREALARRGQNPAEGQVAVCVHTFLGEDIATVREKVSGAYVDYLLVNLGLHAGRVAGSGAEFNPSDSDKEFLMNQASERLFKERGLVGTISDCRERVATLTAIGVDEIACLIDFGIDFDSVMGSLYQLNKLKELCGRPVPLAAGAR
jgi:natural product biosynthesis luciferase-like monooxygenase protein